MLTMKYAAPLSACLAAVTAAPMPVIYTVNTVTQMATVTELVTMTVWVDPPSSTAASSSLAPTTVLASTTTTSTTTSTTSTSSVYVAPPPAANPAAQEVPAVQVVTAAPVPTTTTTTAAASPAATTPAAAAVTTPATSSGSSAKPKSYTGDVTYYDVGLGSCGIDNVDTDLVLAMAIGMMDKPKMCGKTITISHGGSTHTGTIVDTCTGCADGSIDLSPALFKAVVPNGNGRVSGVEWWFN